MGCGSSTHVSRRRGLSACYRYILELNVDMFSDLLLQAGADSGSAPVPRPPSASVQCVDISEALDAMESLHIPSEVSDRVCDAMAIAGAASETGDVTGAQFLRLVVDYGVKTTTAAKLRRRLRIVAPVPPSTVSSCATTYRWVACGCVGALALYVYSLSRLAS
jgi:hypothetical protein